MGAIGKYIDGSGAETTLVESKAYGKNVGKSVMNGSHYTTCRSLKGLMLLSECIERFQWADFFSKLQELNPTGMNLKIVCSKEE